MQYQEKEIQAIVIDSANRSIRYITQKTKSDALEAIVGGVVAFRNIIIGKTRYEMWYRADATIENCFDGFRVVSPCGDVFAGNAALFPRLKTVIQDHKKKVDEIYNSIQFQKKQYNWQPLELDEEDGNPYWEKAHSKRDLEKK